MDEGIIEMDERIIKLNKPPSPMRFNPFPVPDAAEYIRHSHSAGTCPTETIPTSIFIPQRDIIHPA